MKLAQAASYHSNTPFDAWNGTQWVLAAVSGSLQAYDRFITDRSFGLKKRILTIGGAAALPANYEAVRGLDGTIFLITSETPDYEVGLVQMHSYQLLQADHTAVVYRTDDTKNSVGVPISQAEVNVGTFFCDIERYRTESSREFDDSFSTIFNITLALSTGALINNDTRITVGSDRFEVREKSEMLRSLNVVAVRQ